MKKTFEAGMEELEALVSALESGELRLDESFKAYEKAMKLASSLQEQLREGQAKMEALRADLTREDISPEVDA